MFYLFSMYKKRFWIFRKNTVLCQPHGENFLKKKSDFDFSIFLGLMPEYGGKKWIPIFKKMLVLFQSARFKLMKKHKGELEPL